MLRTTVLAETGPTTCIESFVEFSRTGLFARVVIDRLPPTWDAFTLSKVPDSPWKSMLALPVLLGWEMLTDKEVGPCAPPLMVRAPCGEEPLEPILPEPEDRVMDGLRMPRP